MDRRSPRTENFFYYNNKTTYTCYKANISLYEDAVGQQYTFFLSNLRFPSYEVTGSKRKLEHTVHITYIDFMSNFKVNILASYMIFKLFSTK